MFEEEETLVRKDSVKRRQLKLRSLTIWDLLDESGTNRGENSWRKVGAAKRSLAKALGLRLQWARMLRESLTEPVLM